MILGIRTAFLVSNHNHQNHHLTTATAQWVQVLLLFFITSCLKKNPIKQSPSMVTFRTLVRLQCTELTALEKPVPCQAWPRTQDQAGLKMHPRILENLSQGQPCPQLHCDHAQSPGTTVRAIRGCLLGWQKNENKITSCPCFNLLGFNTYKHDINRIKTY
jgi:hypothetical protein